MTVFFIFFFAKFCAKVRKSRLSAKQSACLFRDGGGVTPDIEVKPNTLPNIAIYLDRIDSTEVMQYYVMDYIAKHPTIAKAEDFRLTDADYQDFKKQVIRSGFKYDRETSKVYNELVKMAKFEGYYDDAKEEFEALKKKIDHHDLNRDLDAHREEIQQMIEQDIVSAYYFQAGQMQVGLRTDKALREAVRILTTDGEYEKLLGHAQKSSNE
jgi:carboxyl-terminal processing protease